VDHPESLAKNEAKVRSLSGNGAKTIQVFHGTLDFVAMAQGPGGIHERCYVLWMPRGSLDEEVNGRIEAIGDP